MIEWSRKKKIITLVTFMFFLAIILKILDTDLRYNLSVTDYYKYNRVKHSEIKSFLKGKDLSIGISANPPLAFYGKGNGDNIGMVPDFLSLMAIELKTEIGTFTSGEQEILNALDRGEVDAVILPKTQELEEVYNLSLPIYEVRGKIMVPVNSETKQFIDLKSKMLASMKRNHIRDYSIGNEYFFDSINIIDVDNIYQGFALMDKEFVSGFISDDLEAAYFSKVIGEGDKYRFLDYSFYEKEMCFVVPKKEKELLRILNKGILNMEKEDLISQSQEKWVGSYNNRRISLKQIDLAYKIILTIGIIIGGFSIWNYIMAKKVNSRTKELYESKEELNNIINTLQSGILVIKACGEIIECNEAIAKMLNMNKNDILGNQVDNILWLKPMLKKENNKRILNIDNSYYFIAVHNFGYGKKLMVIDDYTEKYLMENRARQESKMIAIGQLSAGLAHEIRNPLGIIKSYNYVLKKYCNDNISNHAVDVINQSSERINNFVTNLLRFSRLSKNTGTEINIIQLVETITELEEKKLKEKGIIMEANIGGNRKKKLLLNEDILKMILLNLIDNSIESFEVDYDKARIWLQINIGVKDLEISVKDNGAGIDEDKIEHIFNPFFSTKETGTGLGLYLISTEIANEDGAIRVESKRGEGTTFYVNLPLKENLDV